MPYLHKPSTVSKLSILDTKSYAKTGLRRQRFKLHRKTAALLAKATLHVQNKKDVLEEPSQKKKYDLNHFFHLTCVSL